MTVLETADLDLLKLSRVLGKIFMRLCGISWRIRYYHPPGIRAGRTRGRTVLFAFWHGRQLPFIYTHRNEGITVLVSLNTDGQYATNVLHSMGFATVRGSSSSGGMKAIGEMAAVLRSGTDCAITPDGPRGPVYRSSGGAGIISRLSGSPVVPMASSAWPVIRFRSWDGFILPLPFSKVTVVEGRALAPMKRGDDGTWKEMLESRLRSITAAADLASAPGSSCQYALIEGAARLAGVFARAALSFRPPSEMRERLGEAHSITGAPVWLHGSSLGELTGLMPFIRLVEDLGLKAFITCSTPAGREFIEEQGLRGAFAPLDTPQCVTRFLDAVEPSAFVLAETELWPCTIMTAIRRSIPCIMVNARLGAKRMSRYMLLRPLLGRMLSCFTGLLTRSEADSERFRRLGADSLLIRTTADAKACYDPGDPPDEWRDKLGADTPILVAGSTRQGEDRTVAEAALSAGYLPVLAPRHLDRVGRVIDTLRDLGCSPVLWSQLLQSSYHGNPDSVVIDVHGVLARLYGLADAAFVGGTLVDIGGHNVLEPLQRGVPVAVGPHCWNFADRIERGRDEGAIKVVTDAQSLRKTLISFLTARPSVEVVRALSAPEGADPLVLFKRLLKISGVALHSRREQ